MEQKLYNYDALTKQIQENLNKGLVVETNGITLKTEKGVTFNIDEKDHLFHYFKFNGGKVYLFYVKRLLDGEGNVLFENNYNNISYSVYEMFLNVFGRETAKRYAKWCSVQEKEMA